MKTTSDEKILGCPRCGAKNRVSAEKLAENKAICGRCKTPLHAAPEPFVFTDRNFAVEIEN
jgi:uncharacterized paraquat-inducible protein A